jgi:hypothetical protein
MTLEDRVAALEAELERLRHPFIAIEPLNLDPEESKRFAREFKEAVAAAYDQPFPPLKPLPPVMLLTADQVRECLRQCVTVVGPGETLVLRVWGFTPNQVREYQESLDVAMKYGAIPFKVLVVIGEELGVVEAPESTPSATALSCYEAPWEGGRQEVVWPVPGARR